MLPLRILLDLRCFTPPFHFIEAEDLCFMGDAFPSDIPLELNWEPLEIMVGHKLNSVREKADIKSTRIGTQHEAISSGDDFNNKDGFVI